MIQGISLVTLKPAMWVAEQTGQWHRVFERMTRNMPQHAHTKGSFNGYTPTEHDVIVSVFSKSGTNWTMQITHQIAMRGQGEYAHIHDVIPWPDEVIPDYTIKLTDEAPLKNSLTGMRVIKTHLDMEYVPYNDHAKYVFVIRDPKDAFVSSYFFIRSVMFGMLMPSPKTWLDLFLSNNFPLGSWPSHIASCWRLRNESNARVLFYKDMKKDLPGTVRSLAELMGVDLTPEEFDTVVHKSTFQYMKSIDHKFYPGEGSPWSDPNGSMMRKGKAGDSGELLTLADQAKIDEYCRQELRRLGSDFPYDDYFGPHN